MPTDVEKITQPRRQMFLALAGVGAIFIGVVTAIIFIRFGSQPEASTPEQNQQLASSRPSKTPTPLPNNSLELPMGNVSNDDDEEENVEEATNVDEEGEEQASVTRRSSAVARGGRQGQTQASSDSSDSSPEPPSKSNDLTAAQRRMLKQAQSFDDVSSPLNRSRSESKNTSTKRSVPLSSTQIRSTVNQNRSAIQRCYEREMRGASGGTDLRVELRITVQPSGVVAGVRISPSQVRGTSLGSCMESAARRWRFPSATATSTFDVPFVLTARR